MFIAVIFFFITFLRPFLHFENSNLAPSPVPFNSTTANDYNNTYLSEIAINQSSQPNFVLSSTHIKVYYLFDSMFVVSWLEENESPIDPSVIMLIQIFNSKTNKTIGLGN